MTPHGRAERDTVAVIADASLRDEDLGRRALVRTYGANMIQTDNVETLDYLQLDLINR